MQIFKVKEGVNYNPDDPNYDLFKLSMRVSAKRLFPNYDFLDAPFNLRFYRKGRPETEVAYMGCVQESEIITYKLNGNLYVEGISRLKERLSDKPLITYGISQYIDTSGIDLKVYDSVTGGFTKVKKYIINPNRDNWKLLKLSNGRSLTATSDHPLPVEGKGRTRLCDIKVGDKIPVVRNLYSEKNEDTDNNKTELAEVISIEDIVLKECSYDIETESDRFDVSGICSHNCRTRVMSNVYNRKNQITYGRGNLSFTSINLPRLGILAHGDLKKFYKMLDDRLELVHRQLLNRFAIQCSKKVYNYPFLMGQGVWIDSDKLKSTDSVEEVLRNGTLTIGFIGLAECLVALTGKHHGESEESWKLGYEIIQHMRKFTDKISKKEKLNYSVIATPAEGLSGRFVRIDANKFGKIPGVTDREYYTNSFHIPVYYKISAYDKIRLEAPFHELTNGGHITYVEMDGNPLQNMVAFEDIIRYMKECGIGYGAINHPVDRDCICGYTGVIKDICPHCGRQIDENDDCVDHIRRVTGYLSGTTKHFNNAKRAEEKDRVKHI